MSPLMADLHRRLAGASGVEAACLRAELAAHLGRSGEDIGVELSLLREMNVALGDPLLSVWIHIAEGIFEITCGHGDAGLARLRRARAVALAVGLIREQSIVDSWLAYHAYARNDIFEVIDLAKSVLTLSSAADIGALGRVQMLVGQAFHFAGDFAQARPWYESTRAIASKTGDHGLHSALLFNLASHHVCNYRHFLLTGSPLSLAPDLLQVTTASVRSYDELVGVTSLGAYDSTLRASVHLFHGRYIEAFELFKTFMISAEDSGLSRMFPLYVAEMALCAASLERTSEAYGLLEEAIDSIDDDVHVDDRAAANCRIAQVFALLGKQAMAEEYRSIGMGDWSQHELFQAEILERLASGVHEQSLVVRRG